MITEPESEESLLIERRTARARTFDAQPCPGSSLSDLSLDLYITAYFGVTIKRIP